MAYRLLRAILNTAADDELIRRNPCRIPGATVDKTSERPVRLLNQVLDIADAIDAFGPLLLLAAFGSLRWGELMGLRRSDLDLDAGVVKVVRSVAEVGSRQVIKTPNCVAGIREVVLLSVVLPELRRHVATYANRVSTARLRRGEGGDAVPVDVSPGVGAGPGGCRRKRCASARPAARRKPPGRVVGRDDPRADGADGARQHAGRADLPAPTRDRDRRIADSMDLLLGDRRLGTRSKIGHVEGAGAGSRTRARKTLTPLVQVA